MKKITLLQFIFSSRQITFKHIAQYFFENKIFLFFSTLLSLIIIISITSFNNNKLINAFAFYESSFNIEILQPKFREVLKNEDHLISFSNRYRENILLDFLDIFFKEGKYKFVEENDKNSISTFFLVMKDNSKNILNSNKKKIAFNIEEKIKNDFETAIKLNVSRYDYSNDINVDQLRKAFSVKRVEVYYVPIGIYNNFFTNFLLSLFFAILLMSVFRKK
tara:strand:+ start:202 stop:861 length:660 start_codon:yes stop_codon:yes gene_type:complete